MVYVHEVTACFAELCMLCTIEDISFCSACTIVADERLFHEILYLLDGRDLLSRDRGYDSLGECG